MPDKDLDNQAAELLTALIFGYSVYISTLRDQDALIDAHGTLSSARNLLDALQRGRVTLSETDKWVEV